MSADASTVLHHVAWALSVVALGAAGLRVAATMAPRGLARVVAAAVLAAGAALVESLGLGLVGLGGSTAALAAAALATWLAVRLTVAAPEFALGAEIAAAWRGAPTGARVALGAVAGLGAVWTAWILRHPSIGFDATIYHWTEAVRWVQDGHPGAVEYVSYDFPFGNYPLADEVLVSWSAGLARSFAALALWTPALMALFLVAGWSGLRELEVGRLPAALALAAVATVPDIMTQLNEPQTDLPALAWLACAAALCAHARRRTILLAPAMIAAALAVGTKTTTVPLCALLLGLALWSRRAELRSLRRPLLIAGAGALIIGLPWYLRNLLDHGSPFWPYQTVPWGTGTPPFIDLLDGPFIGRIGPTLDVDTAGAPKALAGAIVLLGGALVVPLLTRRRRFALLSAVIAVSLLIWANAPLTGLPSSPLVHFRDGFPLSMLRYLAPVVAAAAVILALVTTRGGAARVLALLALGSAVVWSTLRSLSLELPFEPRAVTLLAGAAAGALVAGAAIAATGRARGPGSRPAWVGGALVAVAAVVVGVGVATQASGFLARQGGMVSSTSPTTGVGGWLARQPRFRDDARPVFVASLALGVQMAGDRLRHRVVLVPPHEPCDVLRARARRGWLLVSPENFGRGFLGIARYDAAGCLRGVRPRFDDGKYRVYTAA
ncbi:MAG: hypothetical protein QOH11_1719 [Solirubrobacteraceae bacterium]|nr:hypothetical protein [Solirubrobacteraceae bacterium]